MITLEHVHYEIHDEVSNNDKVHNSFIKWKINSQTLSFSWHDKRSYFFCKSGVYTISTWRQNCCISGVYTISTWRQNWCKSGVYTLSTWCQNCCKSGVYTILHDVKIVVKVEYSLHDVKIVVKVEYTLYYMTSKLL